MNRVFIFVAYSLFLFFRTWTDGHPAVARYVPPQRSLVPLGGTGLRCQGHNGHGLGGRPSPELPLYRYKGVVFVLLDNHVS